MYKVIKQDSEVYAISQQTGPAFTQFLRFVVLPVMEKNRPATLKMEKSSAKAVQVHKASDVSVAAAALYHVFVPCILAIIPSWFWSLHRC